jgi:hypothetical protein
MIYNLTIYNLQLIGQFRGLYNLLSLLREIVKLLNDKNKL